jgi:hypothetical protein
MSDQFECECSAFTDASIDWILLPDEFITFATIILLELEFYDAYAFAIMGVEPPSA